MNIWTGVNGLIEVQNKQTKETKLEREGFERYGWYWSVKLVDFILSFH